MGQFRAITVGVAALVLAAGLGSPLAADDPGAQGPFPYAELAALAAAVAPPRVVALEATAVRLRPAHDWPTVARLGAGEAVLAHAVTHEYAPRQSADSTSWLRDRYLWLRIATADGVSGWIPSAETSLSDALWRRIDVQPAAPVTARWLGAHEPVGERIGLRARPAGPLLEWQDEVSEGPHGVFGRSADGGWVALNVGHLDVRVVWASIGEVDLEAADLTAADLPFFVGSEVAVLPLGEADGRRPRSIEPAVEWRWIAGNRIVGVGNETFWRYDPETGSHHSVPRPAGRAELSPDGMQLAVELRRPRESDGPASDDLALVSLDDGATLVFADALNVYKSEGVLYLGSWSPDSRAFLSPRVGDDWEFLVVTVSGERYELPKIGAWPLNPWHWRANNGLLYGDSAVSYDGTGLHTIERAVRPAETSIPHWPALQRICALPAKYEYLTDDRGERAWISGEIFGDEEANRISTCLSNEIWPLDGVRTLISDRQSGALWLFDAASGRLREIIAALPPEHRQNLRVVVSVAPGAERLVMHRYGGFWPSDTHLVELLPPYPTTVVAFVPSQICGQRWNWSSDGEQFTAEADAGWGGEFTAGPDGLTTEWRGLYGRERVSQIRFFDRTGEMLSALRTFYAPQDRAWPGRRLMEAKWSPDGRWLAIGGHPARECTTLGH